MTTAEDAESIAEEVYRVDPLARKPRVWAGQTFFTDDDSSKQQWKVIVVSANVNDGFQGMAVVPIVNGVEDYSQVSIAFAGTNFDDPHDIAADAGVMLATQTAQAEDAKAFAAKVKELVQTDHPEATFATVGHSLGGFLALLVAAENRWPATSFNGPDPWRVLTPRTKDWLTSQNLAGTNPLKNYVNRFDTVGNALGNLTGAGIFVYDEPDGSLLGYHNIGKDDKGEPRAFRFGPTGEIIGAGCTAVDLGVILYNLDQTAAAQAVWKMQKDSPYPTVLVAMEPALALAKKIGGLTEHLKAIKNANGSVESEMEDALRDAKNLYVSLHPTMTITDIENSVAVNRLAVHDNLDRDAIGAVDSLVNRQIRMVTALEDGIHNAIVNTLAQDVHAAAAFTSP